MFTSGSHSSKINATISVGINADYIISFNRVRVYLSSFSTIPNLWIKSFLLSAALASEYLGTGNVPGRINWFAICLLCLVSGRASTTFPIRDVKSSIRSSISDPLFCILIFPISNLLFNVSCSSVAVRFWKCRRWCRRGWWCRKCRFAGSSWRHPDVSRGVAGFPREGWSRGF